MASSTFIRSRWSGLTAAVLGAAVFLPAAAGASSIVRQGPGETARSSLTVAAEKPAAFDPAACAAAFHARFADIKAGPFAALKALGTQDAPSADAALPGQFLFAPSTRPRGEAEKAALRSAVALARRQGRTVQPADTNARWISARIREDLSDFLSQGPSPYLCGGIDNYLATMKRYADQIGTSPDRRLRDLQTQREMAAASLTAALAALRPVPVPTMAPADRPDPSVVAQTLRTSIGMRDHETMGPPMLLADRRDGETQISEGNTDPDLPPLSREPARRLESEADILAAVDALVDAARTAGQMDAPVAQTDAMTTGSIGAAPLSRPVLDGWPSSGWTSSARAATVRDPRTRLALVAALSDLEALDYLRLAASEPADPMGAAFAATFDAIAQAHADACGCKP